MTENISVVLSSERGFYVGDPCGVLKEDVFADWLCQKELDGLLRFKGQSYVVCPAPLGCFPGTSFTRYFVFGGSLAVIPLELTGVDLANMNSIGHVFELPGEVKVEYRGGVLEICLPDGNRETIDPNRDKKKGDNMSKTVELNLVEETIDAAIQEVGEIHDPTVADVVKAVGGAMRKLEDAA